jgi:hypothetical protein
LPNLSSVPQDKKIAYKQGVLYSNGRMVLTSKSLEEAKTAELWLYVKDRNLIVDHKTSEKYNFDKNIKIESNEKKAENKNLSVYMMSRV